MARQKRDYKKKSPLEYYRKEYGNRKMTRSQLSEEDCGLYEALCKQNELDKAIPEKYGITYRGYTSPLECFRAKFGNREITRKQLSKEDQTLYATLIRRRQLNEAIPEKQGVTYRRYSSPLACFKEKFKGRKMTRKQLEIEDGGLYFSLAEKGQLDEAIPEKRGKTYRGHASPLEYFKVKFGERRMTRYRLQQEDRGLYSSLLRWKQLDEAIPSRKSNERKAKLEAILTRYAHAGGAE